MVACSEALTSLAFVTRRSRIWTYRTKTLRSSPRHAPNRARSPARGPGERVATLRQAPSCQGRVVLAQAEPWASAAAGHAFVVPYGTLLPVSRATRQSQSRPADPRNWRMRNAQCMSRHCNYAILHLTDTGSDYNPHYLQFTVHMEHTPTFFRRCVHVIDIELSVCSWLSHLCGAGWFGVKRGSIRGSGALRHGR